MASLCSSSDILFSSDCSLEEVIDFGFQASEHIEDAFSPHAGDSGLRVKDFLLFAYRLLSSIELQTQPSKYTMKKTALLMRLFVTY